MTLTICEWEVAIAAYAYEFHDKPTMTDNTYDRLCAGIEARGSGIPGFSAMTGQWVHNMDTELLGRLWRAALSVNDGKQDLHMPAVKWALQQNGQAFRCCHGDYTCWDDGE